MTTWSPWNTRWRCTGPYPGRDGRDPGHIPRRDAGEAGAVQPACTRFPRARSGADDAFPAPCLGTTGHRLNLVLHDCRTRTRHADSWPRTRSCPPVTASGHRQPPGGEADRHAEGLRWSEHDRFVIVRIGCQPVFLEDRPRTLEVAGEEHEGVDALFVALGPATLRTRGRERLGELDDGAVTDGTVSAALGSRTTSSWNLARPSTSPCRAQQRRDHARRRRCARWVR